MVNDKAAPVRGRLTRRATTALLLGALMISGTTGIAATGAAERHVAAAREFAGTQWQAKFTEVCNLDMPDRPDPVANATPEHPVTPRLPASWGAEPVKIFDNVYFVGSRLVSAFAIDTPEGIIITDAMGEVDIAGSVVDGLTKLGLDPYRIRYVIIPHGHPDHYGGAQYLKERFAARIVMAADDVETLRFYGARVTTKSPETFDQLVRGGDRLSLGGTTVTFHAMPGHTPGGVVMTFPVTLNRAPHKMLIWSAGGSPAHTISDLRSQLAALRPLSRFVRRHRIDAISDNHGAHLLAERMRGNGEDNPFLVGRRALRNYLVMRSECDLAWLSKLEGEAPAAPAQ